MEVPTLSKRHWDKMRARRDDGLLTDPDTDGAPI